MIALGIDPGIGRTGWGIVSSQHGTVVSVEYGCIETFGSMVLPGRLMKIHNALTLILERFNPNVAGVEMLLFNKNTKTAMTVGQARGVILFTLQEYGVKVIELSPLAVKQSVAGYGRATKDQVGRMLKVILKLRHIPKPDDAADALAIATTVLTVSRTLAAGVRGTF